MMIFIHTEKLCDPIAVLGKKTFCETFKLDEKEVDAVLNQDIDTPISTYMKICIALKIDISDLIFIWHH